MRNGAILAGVAAALLFNLSARGACARTVSHPAVLEIVVSSISCSDQGIAANVNDSIRSELKRIPSVIVVDESSARPVRLRLEAECLALDAHVLVRLRVVDGAAKTSTVTSESVLVRRAQLGEVVGQVLSRIIIRVREVVDQTVVSKKEHSSKRQVVAR